MVGKSLTTNHCECKHEMWGSDGICIRCGRMSEHRFVSVPLDPGMDEAKKKAAVDRRRCSDCGGSGFSKKDGKPCRKH